ncbi:hypothetical protein [Pedobacter sp. Leaf250]|uniref:hypothetical protein n=1 Tax=Pedobacter sp. Leaf250 TaxID=2876559 RepID=UPI001E3ABD3A|nr:hypothetical protein [Pedobacter sp. Leaf250]
MIVSSQTYAIILIAIVVLISLKPLYSKLVKKQGKKDDWMFLLILLILPINWYTPTLITVTDCNQFIKEVMLFPAKREGISISYGRKNHIFNHSKQTLGLEYLYYGSDKKEDGQRDLVIFPGKTAMVNEVKIDYVFEAPAKSVSTKSSGATKTMLYCEKDSDEQSIQ